MSGRETSAAEPTAQTPTGIEGLDEILRGGFPRGEMHLVQGSAGTGKTTLALQFLLDGVRGGERALYITLAQTKQGLEAIARSHGWSLDGVAVHELPSATKMEETLEHQTVLHTSEVELGELTDEVRRLVARIRPNRLVLDSIGVVALLAGSPSRYHREVVKLHKLLAGEGCTALFLGEVATRSEDDGPARTELQALAASLVLLEQHAPDYGEPRRRLSVIKVRGVPFSGGYHNFRIRTGGIEVYPRLAAHDAEYHDFRTIPSGLEELDTLLGGGLQQGTACLCLGPPAVGKSTLAAIYARAVARSGEKACIFLFDERPETFTSRARALGVDLGGHLESGHITLEQVRPAEITPGQFAHEVQLRVEQSGARLVVIDSLTGYFNSLGNVPMLSVQMHELLNYLSRRAVLTLLLMSQPGLVASGTVATPDVSYLSDSILLFNMFEDRGTLRRCISAVKKRQGEHDTTIRELFIDPTGVRIGKEPLRHHHNVLSTRRISPGGPRGDGGGSSDG